MNDTFTVIKTLSHRFVIDYNGEPLICTAKSVNKADSILAGDRVRVAAAIITAVLPRKNRLIRPAIASVDQLIIVVSSVPAPDLYMVDKLIVNCCRQSIEPIICINKDDLNEDGFAAQIREQYADRRLIITDALHQKIAPLTDLLRDKLTCLAGQSAVGKSTLINAVLGGDARKTGELSDIKRGRNTTTDTELFYAFGGLIADTPGFSLLDIHDLNYAELDLYYPEFEGLITECKYHRCTHTVEPGCAVKAAAQSGQINPQRYGRYVEIFNQLKEADKKKYK